MSYSEKLKDFVQNNLYFLIILAIIYVLSILTVLFTPRGFEIPEIATTSPLFGRSLAATILLLGIGSYLLYRYSTKGERAESQYQLFWALAFIIYSFTFIGLMFMAWGFEFANMNQPTWFFVWRAPMILWAAIMWIGTMKLFSDKKSLVFLPALTIMAVGFGWFYIGLFSNPLADTATVIENTMYGFLFGEFIPMAIVLSYMWYKYSKDTGFSSTKLLMLGFGLLALTYAAWAPWHFSDLSYVYFVWFDLFNVSLALILAGFFALPKETTSSVVLE